MNKLPKEKRDQLVLVLISTVAVLAGIYFGLIRPQYGTIAGTQKEIKAAQNKLVDVENVIKKQNATVSALFDVRDALAHAEDDMAFGDINAWTYDLIRHFNAAYKVNITVGQPTAGDVELLADFPYKSLKFNINGTAYYHDLGKFVSDLENDYPHMRLVNISIEPAGGTGEDAEKLSFRMNIIALIKSNVAAK